METAGGRWGILTDGRTPRPFFASYSRLDRFPYGLQRTQPEPQHRGKKKRRQGGRSSRKQRTEKTVARRGRLGGNHAAQEERRGKDWEVSFNNYQRRFCGNDTAG